MQERAADRRNSNSYCSNCTQHTIFDRPKFDEKLLQLLNQVRTNRQTIKKQDLIDLIQTTEYLTEEEQARFISKLNKTF